MKQISNLKTRKKFKKTEVGEIPVDWEILNFKKCIEKKKTKIPKSIPQSEYNSSGKYPVIDQSIKFVAGYTNDEYKIIKRPLPVIIFGDHTRIFKFINFSFAIGADGTKLIFPDKQNFDAKFLYYYLSYLDIPSEGYNRHFKLLKEKYIATPPIAEQKRIAKILSTVDEAIEKKNEIIEKTKKLKKGLMQKLLTKGIGYKKFKKTKLGKIPVKWQVVNLKTLYKSPIRDFGSFSTTKLVKYIEEGIPFLRSENFKGGKFIDKVIMYIDKKVHKRLTKSVINKGILMYTKIGNIGHADIYDGRYGECNSNATIAKIDIDEKKANISYIRWFLNSKITLRQLTGKIISAPPRINLGDISKIRIYLPSFREQKKIANILTSVEEEIEKQVKHKEELETIKKGLMQKLLTGKIRVST